MRLGSQVGGIQSERPALALAAESAYIVQSPEALEQKFVFQKPEGVGALLQQIQHKPQLKPLPEGRASTNPMDALRATLAKRRVVIKEEKGDSNSEDEGVEKKVEKNPELVEGVKNNQLATPASPPMAASLKQKRFMPPRAGGRTR